MTALHATTTLDPDRTLDLDRRDALSLAPGVHLTEDGTLVDTWLDTESTPNATAAAVLARLDGGPTTLIDLTTAIADEFEVPIEVAEPDVRLLLASLDDRAAIVAERSPRSYLAPHAIYAELKALIALRPRRKVARRHPATIGGLAMATWRQSRLALATMAVAGLGLSALLQVQAAAQVDRRDALAAGAVLVVLAVLHALLLLVHELGHAVVLRSDPSLPVLVAVRGFRIGVVYPGEQVRRPRLAAAAGPVLAAALAFALGIVGTHLDAMPLAALRLAPLLGIAHLASLLPWSADGRTLWTKGRAAR